MRVPRIELLHAANVTRATVLLADLLPVGAGDSLRKEAREISLGASPQPGRTRLLGRNDILGDLDGSADIAAEVAVPEQVVVSREARPLSTQEIFAAIRSALAQVSDSAAEKLAPEDVLLQAEILVSPGDAGLEVLHFAFDPGMKRSRFLLWASRDPSVLPFYVAVKFADNPAPIALTDDKVSRRILDQRRLFLVAGQKTGPQILVSPGEKATLVLRSDELNMVADVVPLERGKMGQQVRVRIVDTGKILIAQVDGRAHLESQF